MKTSMKKKALISSVSMLSVAALALGSATYAWFTTSTEATANGISIGTSANSQLQISSVNNDWCTKFSYDFTANNTETGDPKTLLPTSTADGKNWFEGVAADGTKHDVDSTGFTKITSGISNYALVDQFNVRNAGSASLYNTKITFTVDTSEISSNGKDYFRMAVVPAEAKGADKANVLGDGNTFFTYVVGLGNDTYKAVTAAGPESDSNTTAAAATKFLSGGTYEISLGELTANQEVDYNLYIWFEGQDNDCYDANAGVTVPSITVKATCTKEA